MRSFVEVVRGVLVEPARLFGGLGGPDPENVKGPLVFAIICGAISVPLGLLVQPLNPATAGQPGLVSGFFSLTREDPTLAAVVLFVLLLPLFSVLGVYVGAAIQHFFVFLFVRQRSGYWGTFPVVAYAGAISLLSWIPVVGYLASLYGIYMTTMGLKEMHNTTTTRALLAALLPTLIALASTIQTLLSSPSII